MTRSTNAFTRKKTVKQTGVAWSGDMLTGDNYDDSFGDQPYGDDGSTEYGGIKHFERLK